MVHDNNCPKNKVMNGRSYTYVGRVECEFSSGDLYARDSRIAEVEVDVLSLGPFCSNITQTHCRQDSRVYAFDINRNFPQLILKLNKVFKERMNK